MYKSSRFIQVINFLLLFVIQVMLVELGNRDRKYQSFDR